MMKIGRFFQLVALIFIAAGAHPAISSVWQWSTTASNNANADPSINWAEGMSPSSINDSARAMMAAVAKWNQDSSAAAATGGTTSAMTFTSQSGFTNLAALSGQRIAFLNSTGSNAAGVTLNVDGTGAAPIVTATGAPVAAGALLSGGVYTVTYYSSDGNYHLWGAYNNTFNIPLGGLLYSTLGTPPNANFVAAAGQCLSTTTYSAYWAALGSPATGGCAGGQFPLPLDARGRSLVGLDNLGGAAAGRLTSANPGCGTSMQTMGASCANGQQTQTLTLAQLPTGIQSNGSNNINVQSTNSLVKNASLGINPGAASATPVWFSGSSSQETSSGTNFITVTSANTSGQAHSVVNPNAAVYIYVRVL